MKRKFFILAVFLLLFSLGGNQARLLAKDKYTVMKNVKDETIWKPNNVKRWQYIIGEMVKRYSVDNKYVTYWGIGNEINIGEWGGCPYKIPDANDYFEYYKWI